MTSRHAVTIAGRTRVVEVGETDGRLSIVVDGEARAIDARAVGEGTWSLIEAGRARLVQVDGTLPKLAIEVSHADGEPRAVAAEVTDVRGAGAEGARAATTGPVTLRAPIPGKLVKVLVKTGERVTSAQPLLVLEAMKMENELRAPRDGVVSRLHAGEGETVEAGQELISIGDA